jgi:hypothetical protein
VKLCRIQSELSDQIFRVRGIYWTLHETQKTQLRAW